MLKERKTKFYRKRRKKVMFLNIYFKAINNLNKAPFDYYNYYYVPAAFFSFKL